MLTANPLDEEIDRRGTNSLKWEYVQSEDDPQRWLHTDRSFGEDRVLPMWVADMDFLCPDPVVQAVVSRAEKGIYGYSIPGDEFYKSVVGWMSRRHGWTIDPATITVAPGVVAAINVLVRALTSNGDKVLIQPPVYYPFYTAIEGNGAQVLRSPLLYRNGQYEMDFADIATKLHDPAVKMAILCSPHNPVGRVWTRDELTRFGELCLARDVLVVSDEIHGDLIMRGSKFTPYATLSPELTARAIICTAPSKTFNLAGLKTSCIMIADEKLRTEFRKGLRSIGFVVPNSFGIVALQAAYDHGEPWLEQLLDYLTGNLHFLEDYLKRHIPQIELVKLEGTYLAWLDCRKLGLDAVGLKQLMQETARVYMDEGRLFGPEGEGFERINIACPRTILVEALGRIRMAVEGMGVAGRA